ncbi:hypothetical protein F5879DRAFT_169587 [Lentinula edodes]|nr:hypothetical protein F5879DRAFT_169587 [Lentinula edodes]
MENSPLVAFVFHQSLKWFAAGTHVTITISLRMSSSVSSSNIEDGYPFPIFSAAHSDAQDLAIHSWSNSIERSHGVGDVSSKNNSADNGNVQWPHWRSSHLGFSSKFKGELADLVTEVKEGNEETTNGVQKEKEVDKVAKKTISNQRRVEEFQEIAWRESHRETSRLPKGKHVVSSADVLHGPRASSKFCFFTILSYCILQAAIEVREISPTRRQQQYRYG